MPATHHTSVSLCMIVRNEERHLADCLRPVAELFDEIVVVDTGSHDGTRDVAAQFTPHLFDFPWCDDFSAARNECLRHAHGDWIFWLDADDRLTPDNVAKLRQLFKELDDQPRAYLLNTVCPSRFECEGARVITHPRLFRRHPELRWQGRVHEQLRPAPGELGYELVFSDVQIEHLGYQEATAVHRKLQRDVRLLRMDYAVNPDEPSTLVHLGIAYSRLGKKNDARACFDRLLQVATDRSDYLRQVYGVLAELAAREGDLAQSLAWAERGLAIFPDDENLQYVLAEVLYEVDRFAEAQRALERLLASPPTAQYRGSVPHEIRQKLAPLKLGDVLRLRGAYAAAETLLRSLAEQYPRDAVVWHTLGRVYLDAGRKGELLAVAEGLQLCPQGAIFANLLRATWHLTHREPAPAGALIDQLIAEAPQMPLPRLLRAEWLVQSQAPLDDQIQACRDLLRVQPGNLNARQVLAHLESRRAATRPQTAPAQATVVMNAGLAGV